jgi:hypothetical protein
VGSSRHKTTLFSVKEETMSDPLKYPQWQLPARDGVLEFYRRRLPAKIRCAEQAIQERLHALGHPWCFAQFQSKQGI